MFSNCCAHLNVSSSWNFALKCFSLERKGYLHVEKLCYFGLKNNFRFLSQPSSPVMWPRPLPRRAPACPRRGPAPTVW